MVWMLARAAICKVYPEKPVPHNRPTIHSRELGSFVELKHPYIDSETLEPKAYNLMLYDSRVMVHQKAVIPEPVHIM